MNRIKQQVIKSTKLMLESEMVRLISEGYSIDTVIPTGGDEFLILHKFTGK